MKKQEVETIMTFATMQAGTFESEACLNVREYFEERAGILEYDAGLTRADAETKAAWSVIVKFGLLANMDEDIRSLTVDLLRRARDPFDDQRYCRECKNLSNAGRCMASRAVTGEQSYFPVDTMPRRCRGYDEMRFDK